MLRSHFDKFLDEFGDKILGELNTDLRRDFLFDYVKHLDLRSFSSFVKIVRKEKKDISLEDLISFLK